MVTAVRSFARNNPSVVDAVGAGALFLLLVFAPSDTPPESTPTVTAIVLFAISCVALVARRRWPLSTLAVTVGVALPAVALGAGTERLLAPVLVATYTVAARTSRRTAVLTAVPTAILFVSAAVLLHPVSGFTAERLGRFAWIGMAAAIGDAVRSGRAYVTAIQERADRAERTREEEARRRVAEERLHIARELHDVIAHHIAVINLQAGVAAHLLVAQPTDARTALGHVRRASRTILDELTGLLGVLRQTGDPEAPTEPAPGMADVGALVEGFRASGLDMRWLLTGPARALPPTVDHVAYRVLQEALTNAHRHGIDTTTVAVIYGPSELTLEIANAVKAEQVDHALGAGLGLLGMRERANAVGGTVSAGTDAHTFRVRAVLPLPAEDADASIVGATP